MIELEHLNFGFKRTDIKPKKPQILNELEHVHLLAIELELPIFGFERSNIELQT